MRSKPLGPLPLQLLIPALLLESLDSLAQTPSFASFASFAD